MGSSFRHGLWLFCGLLCASVSLRSTWRSLASCWFDYISHWVILGLISLLNLLVRAYQIKRAIGAAGGWFIGLKERQLADLHALLKLRLEELKQETSYYKTKSLLERYEESPKASKEAIKLSKESHPLAKEKSPKGIKQRKSPNKPSNSNQLIISHPPMQPLPLSMQPLPLPPPMQQRLQSTFSPPMQPQFKTPNWMDRLMDALIGDDSRNQKYALICQQCFSHNGLAAPEAFPSLKYKCPNCGFLNLPKKSLDLPADSKKEENSKSSE